MTLWLFDTNMVSAGRMPERLPRQVATWLASIPLSAIFISIISLIEIEVGVRRLERRDAKQGAALRRWKTEQVARAFAGRVLPVDSNVTEQCAALFVPDPRPQFDSLIAATAMAHRLTLATRNVSDFEIAGLQVFNPWTIAA